MSYNQSVKNSEQPLITIITAVYNASEFLERTILSVLNQTWSNIEYIIIDGGSTDGTLDIIRKYEQPIAYWVSEPDKGIYDAWNKAIKLARGEWIVFLGAGDTYYPNAVSTYMNTIEASENRPDLISSRVSLVDSGGRSMRVWGAPFIWIEFKKAMKFAHAGALHHRSLFENYGLFDVSYRSAGDYDFFMRCGKEIHALFIDTVTADVLVGGISLNNCTGLLEVCNIQKIYGMNPAKANLNYYLARIKQRIRPLLRGY